MSAPNGESRPPARKGGAQVDHDDDTADSTVRCWLCGRPLHAEASVRLGIGPKCWDARMGGAA